MTERRGPRIRSTAPLSAGADTLRPAERFDTMFELAPERVPASRMLNVRAATANGDFLRGNDERTVVVPVVSTRRRTARH